MIWEHGLGLDFGEGSDNESNADNRILASYCQILRGELTATDHATKAILKSLPPLESFCAIGNYLSFMDMAGLVMVLHHSQGTLKEFPGGLQLFGSDDDFQNLLHSLRLLKALQIFEWQAHGYTTNFDEEEESEEDDNDSDDDTDSDDDNDAENEDVDVNFNYINIDDVLQAITAAKAPLSKLSLLRNYRCPSPLVLEGCLNGNKSTLRTFEANVNNWDHVTVQAMKAYLASDDCRLEELTLGQCTISMERFPIVKDLVGAIFMGINSLRKLDVSTYTFSEQGENTDEIYMEFYLMAAELLRTNTNLQSFVQSLGIYVIPDAVMPRVVKAFVTALKENTTLERVELRLSERQRSHPAMVDMNRYLEMNRLGRKNIHENGHSMSRSAWVSEMAKDTSNVDWLLFLLKSNPMLCQSAPLNEPTADGPPSRSSPSTTPSNAPSSVSSSCKSNSGKRKRD